MTGDENGMKEEKRRNGGKEGREKLVPRLSQIPGSAVE